MSARARGIPEKICFIWTCIKDLCSSYFDDVVTISISILFRALVFEGIFSWPGMGNLYWAAVQQNDIPVLLGNLSITTLIYISGIVLLDLIYGFLDPR